MSTGVASPPMSTSRATTSASSDATAPATYSFDDCTLNPKASFRPGDPFMIVSVDKKIMSGHNDITNPVLINFLREFVLFCQTNPQHQPE